MKTSTVHQPKQLTGKLLAVLVLLGISVFIHYIDRGNLSIAGPMLKDELRISATQLGILLSTFFWTYACLQPTAGWLVVRVNVSWVIEGFFLWSAATAATGLGARCRCCSRCACCWALESRSLILHIRRSLR